MNVTEISAITEHRNGVIEVKFSVTLGGVNINRPHRTAFTPSSDAGAVDAHMATVNAHCVALGYAPVSQADIDYIKAKAAALWTPDIVSAFEASQV